MNRNELIEILMMLYSRRVKSLIGTDDDSIIRELLELMFVRFDDISRKPGYEYFAYEMEVRIGEMLQTQENIKSSQEDMRNLIGRLEKYIQFNIQVFWPNKIFRYNPNASKEERDKNDYRKFIGGKIREMAEDKTGKYKFPVQLDEDKSYLIYKQLYQITQMRNRFTHLDTAGQSVMYVRCHYLEMSEILLSYILQTYYYKCLSMNVGQLTD